MKKFLAKNIVLTVIGVAIVVSGAFAAWYTVSNRAPSFAGVSVVKGTVVESLQEPGTVRAENNANLSFQEVGQIAHVYVHEGEAVNAGTVLADLESASLQASVSQANAALAAAKAKLDGLTAGTRPEQITIDQTAVASAQATLSADIANAYASADDAVRNQIDNMFTNPKSMSPQFNIVVSDSQIANAIPSTRLALEGALNQWYAVLNASSLNVNANAAGSTGASVASLANLENMAATTLSQVQSYLNMLAPVVNDAVPTSNITAATLAGYKANIVTARTEISTAVTTVVNAQSALVAAQNTLSLAQAGATSQDIEAQQASVAQAQAAAQAAQVALNNARLVAPFSGVVQNVTAQVGQVVSPGAPLLSLVNNGGLKIEAYLSEADVSKVMAGDAAQVTLDAFGTGQTFPATVTTVGNAQSQSNGAPAYLVTLHFTQPESQVKDGMTGNVQIILAKKDNVLEVPNRLVVNDNGQYFVLVKTAAGVERRQVTIGLTGDGDVNGGVTEIVSGLNEGDQLANF